MLPEGWSVTTLADCQARTESLDPRRFPDEAFDLFSVPSYSNYEPEVAAGRDIGSTKQEVREGDVLLCKIVPHIRRGWVVPRANGKRQIASGEWIVFRDHGLDPEYLRRFVLSDRFHEQFMRTVSGVGGSLMRARPAEARKIEVPVPPLPEQRRIVAKLDALTGRLARARAELDRVPVLVARMRETALREAYCPVASTVRVADVTSRVTKGSSPRWQGYEYQSDGVLFVRSQNVRWGSLDLDDHVCLPKAFNDKARNSVIRPGDVLLNIVGASIGRAAVAPDALDGANCNQAVCLMRPRDREDAKYLMFFIISPGAQAAIRDGAVDVARANFSLAQAKSLSLPWPSAAERRSTVERIERAFARADRLEAEAARARALLDRLEAAMLARAFRGELVPQDPNDEPATALLARIRAQREAAPKAKRGRRAKGDA